jgi:DNA-binding MarR family transcriptional regulator
MNENTQEYILEESIGYITRNFFAALRNRLIADFEENDFDISIDEWVALSFLNRFDDRNQQQLGELLMQEKTAVTRLLDCMQKAGIVERITDQDDKRNKIIRLTEKGKDCYKNVVPVVENAISDAHVGISNDEIENTKSIIRKMRENLLGS